MFATWSGLAGLGLLGVSLMLAYYTLWFRVDSLPDLDFIRGWNVVLGLLFAGAVLLLGFASKAKRANRVLALATWVLVSGFLTMWHETIVSARWAAPKRTLALNQIKMAQQALRQYTHDCGGFPPEEKGLAALSTGSGEPGWAGPYQVQEMLIDPWGNRLEYRLRGDRAEVWSNGPDGQSGTDDDVRLQDRD